MNCNNKYIDPKIELMEQQLGIKVPEDLQQLWSDTNFRKSNTIFLYRSFPEMEFKFPDQLTERTLAGDAGIIHSEKNRLYFLKKEGAITDDEYLDMCQEYEKDLVMISKAYPRYNGFKALVFASSTWYEGFTDMFYRFDDNGNSEGIFILKHEMSSAVPFYLGANLEEVFGTMDKLRGGFSEEATYLNFWGEYGENERKGADSFVYGVFPQQNMKDFVQSIVSDIVFFEYYSELDVLTTEKKKELSMLYEQQGINLDFNIQIDDIPSYDQSLITYLERVNKRPSNEGKPKRIFILEGYGFYPNKAVASCTPEEARLLDSYNLIWEFSDQSNIFMYNKEVD